VIVRLVPMTAAQYEEWHERSVQGYAEEKAKAGNWPADDALRRSREEFARLLPDGLATSGNWLFSVEDADSETAVGILWLARMPGEGDAGRRAFIYDFEIDAAHRRRGYGRAALAALDERARELGFAEIGLHVFGHNLAARALYERAGYEVTNVNMSKRIS
jgi:ribosomal protein S18 acetylase RimI-like enzyme